jgi:hypothetical protein
MIKLKTGAYIKTHTELGISFREWAALFSAWGVFANNLLPHTKPYDREVVPNEHLFNMNVACEAHDCGTVGCIGGTMGLAMGLNPGETRKFVDIGGFEESKFKLSRLFYPRYRVIDWDKIDGIHAAEAIWNVLRTGEPDWESIVPHLPDKDATYRPYKGMVKSHTALKISFTEWLALIGVRVMLDCGAIKMVPEVGSMWRALKYLDEHDGAHVFNMGNSMQKSHCGTVGCIGGYMGEMVGMEGHEYVNRHDSRDQPSRRSPLTPLFFPPINLSWQNITAEQAVHAIDTFLTTGKPEWPKNNI